MNDNDDKTIIDLSSLFELFQVLSTDDENQSSGNSQPVENVDVLVVPPGEIPYTTTVPNTLKAFQSIVGGRIDIQELPFEQDPVTGITPAIVLNDDGKIIGLPGCRRFKDDIIAGTFCIVGSKEDADGEKDFVSLPEDMMFRFSRRFWNPEKISDKEVRDAIRFDFRIINPNQE